MDAHKDAHLQACNGIRVGEDCATLDVASNTATCAAPDAATCATPTPAPDAATCATPMPAPDAAQDEEQWVASSDFFFYKKKKKGKFAQVEYPRLPMSVVDTHTHFHMLPDPAFELARCAFHHVDFLGMITDPSETGTSKADALDTWLQRCSSEFLVHVDGAYQAPEVGIIAGIHPHNARLFTPAVREQLCQLLVRVRCRAVGEVGLDYYYDLSPRDVQQQVFREHIRLAHHFKLPIMLHLRDAELAADDSALDTNDSEHVVAGESTANTSNDSERAANSLSPAITANAHADALRILREEGFPEAGTIVHCCTLTADELRPFVEADCYIAYGGAFTFKKNEAVRRAMEIVPLNRLLTETDSPYMAPEPMRGTTCTPAHVIFNAYAFAAWRAEALGESEMQVYQALWDNAHRILRRRPS